MARPKTGGRKKGTPNKASQALLELVREAVGDKDYHPVVAMAMVAVDEDVEPSLRFQANKEVAQYCAPKLKAIEHSVSDEMAAVFNMNFGVSDK